MPLYKVAFNKDQKELYDKLKEKGLTSKPFSVFVRDAFYNEVDKLNPKQKEVS
jgi:hypothetical protein